jgi:hypothetical protein
MIGHKALMPEVVDSKNGNVGDFGRGPSSTTKGFIEHLMFPCLDSRGLGPLRATSVSVS